MAASLFIKLTRTPTFDVLYSDGGWLTPEGIAMVSGQNRDAVKTALLRLIKKGYVEHRKRPLGFLDNNVWEYRVNYEAVEEAIENEEAQVLH